MSETAETASGQIWGVGVELAEDHMGPIRFVAQLVAGREDDEVVGLHVLPRQELLRPLVTREEAKAMRKRVEHDITEVLAREGLAKARSRSRVELVEDDQVDRGLAEATARLTPAALVVGRRAKRDADPIVRLGEVTRRVLRRLPAPVIVVPPDFGDPDDPGLGEGPVLLATDLSPGSAAAARFARDLAARLGRELVLAHATQAFHWGVSYIPARAMDEIQERTVRKADDQLGDWARAQGISDVPHHVFSGDPVKGLLQLAARLNPALLVTGSRELGPVERLFLASVSSELAASGSCPIAVVPGDE